MEAVRGPRTREGSRVARRDRSRSRSRSPSAEKRSWRSERREKFFRGHGDGAPETNDVFALSAEDRGTSVKTALCCSAGIDDQAQTPQSARFSEEQRKLRKCLKILVFVVFS